MGRARLEAHIRALGRDPSRSNLARGDVRYTATIAMPRSIALAIAILVSAACTAPRSPEPRAPQAPEAAQEPRGPRVSAALEAPASSGALEAPASGWYEVVVVSADIQGRMANGEDWDDGKSGAGRPPALIRYLAEHPELSLAERYIGIPVDDPDLEKRARKSRAADPMVLIEIGEHVFRSPVHTRAFHPVWDFAFRFHYQAPAPGAGPLLVRVHVVDYDSAEQFDSIGSTILPIDELLARNVQQLRSFGAVDLLTLQVRRLGDLDEKPASAQPGRRLSVPGKPTWTDTGIQVIAGQRVDINAADEMCTSGDDDDCSGPEGQRSPHDKNAPGFPRLGHGALIGAIGDTRFPVLREAHFVSPATGVLRLGVNDVDSGNNRGAYQVHVQVRE